MTCSALVYLSVIRFYSVHLLLRGGRAEEGRLTPNIDSENPVEGRCSNTLPSSSSSFSSSYLLSIYELSQQEDIVIYWCCYKISGKACIILSSSSVLFFQPSIRTVEETWPYMYFSSSPVSYKMLQSSGGLC